MLNAQIDLAKLADFMLEEVDCSPDFEEDAFRVDYAGQVFYVERYTSHFYMEDTSGASFELPRH